MTEQELVDFAIEQINAHDDWDIGVNGRYLRGPPTKQYADRHLVVGQGMGTPMRAVVGNIKISSDEGLDVVLMDAVKDRARELQTLKFNPPLKPEPPVEKSVAKRIPRWWFMRQWSTSAAGSTR